MTQYNYRILIAFLLAASTVAGAEPIPFTQMTLDPQPPSQPYYKMVGDLDGDGDRDVIVGGSKGPLVWYANPGWKKTTIAAGGWNGVNGEVADLDGDGDADLVMGGCWSMEGAG